MSDQGVATSKTERLNESETGLEDSGITFKEGKQHEVVTGSNEGEEGLKDTAAVSKEGNHSTVGITSEEGQKPEIETRANEGDKDYPIKELDYVIRAESKELDPIVVKGTNKSQDYLVQATSKEENFVPLELKDKQDATFNTFRDGDFVASGSKTSKDSITTKSRGRVSVALGSSDGQNHRSLTGSRERDVGLGSKEGQGHIAWTGSNEINHEQEERDDVIRSESKEVDRSVEEGSKEEKHSATVGSKDWHSILKQQKSQKSQILLSDLKVGSGLNIPSMEKNRTQSESNKNITSSQSMADNEKEGEVIESQTKANRSGTQTKLVIPIKTASTQRVSQTKVEHISSPQKRSQRSQLLLQDSRPGLQMVGGIASRPSDPNVGPYEDRSASDERFLSASAQSINIMDSYHKPSPFSTRWVRGYNNKVPVINLNKQGSTILFYAAVNFGILYNWTTNSMVILEGHKHTVTNIAADADARWFVTADSGPENIITIWSAETYYPHKTIFAPHGGVRLAKMAFSTDAKFLLTLAYTDKACLNFWQWSVGLDVPHASLQLDIPLNSVVSMGFNPENSQQFLLMSKQDIWLGVSRKIFALEKGVMKETDDYELKIRCPPKKLAGVDPGSFTHYTFVANTSQVLVATSKGAVLVYGYTLQYLENVDCNEMQFEKFIFVKLVKVEKHRINYIHSIDGVVVTGNSCGEIRFYDEHLLLKYWVHGFRPDSVRALSFNLAPRSYQILDPKCKSKCFCWEQVVVDVDPLTGVARQKLMNSQLPLDATTANRPFLVRDFVLTSHNQGIHFVDFATEVMHQIVDCKISPALSIDVHPEKSFLVIGYADGVIELFNFMQYHLLARADTRQHYTVQIPPKLDSTKCTSDYIIPGYSVTYLKYSPSGLHLACGLNTGEIIFVDPTTVSILTAKPYRDTSHAIQEISFSPDSKKLATADVGRTVCLYSYECGPGEPAWVFVGKHRAHYKDIVSVFFTPEKNDDGNYKLISLGMDRIMVEYDVGQTSDEYLEIHSLDRFEQVAVPLCGIVWPNDTTLNPEEYRTDIPMLLFANDENKYKVLNYQTTMTLSVTLGPRYDTPVCRLKLVSGKDGSGNTAPYLMFATKTVVGVHKMPLDGNPWRHVGVMAHPNQITGWCFRDDLGTLFTIGARDSCMVQWAAKFKSVDITTKCGGDELDPYYCLIENGRPGWLFQEIRDLFYYIQILCQGTFSPAIRQVKDYIPIDSLPDLMRALGFFPTEFEVENLIVEAMYKVNQQAPSSEVDFEEFVKLYLNHRPAFGDSSARVRGAFRAFARFDSDDYVMTRDELLDVLSNNGEHFSRELSWYLLSILCGVSFEERATMQHEDFSFLPQIITYNDFVSQLLGIQDLDPSDRYSLIDSAGSRQTSSASVTSADKKWTHDRR